jgi:hypothetical protein
MEVIKMKEVDKAWLAAAIDGEGTLSINRRNKGRKCFVVLRVFNNDINFVKKAKRIIDESYGERLGGICKRKDCGTFNYTLSRPDIIRKIIVDLEEFWIVKKHNAGVCLKFIDGEVSNYKIPKQKQSRRYFSGNDYLKGNRGDSEGHRRSASFVKNHYLKGNRGNILQHKRAGMQKGKLKTIAYT